MVCRASPCWGCAAGRRFVLLALALSLFPGTSGHSDANGDVSTSRSLTSNGSSEYVAVTIDSHRVLHVTDKRFVSAAFTFGQLRAHWKQIDLRSVRLQTLAKGLYPAYLRLGGTRANYALFRAKGLQAGDSNFTYTEEDWDEINEFSRAVGWDFIFDLNEFLRTPHGWDSTNFRRLLKYSARRNYTVAGWQLGNEPNAYRHTAGVVLGPSQVARDFIKLRAVLDASTLYAGGLLIGPDITKPKHELGTSALSFLDRFLAVCGDCINVTSFHSYYLHSQTARLDDFVDPSVLNSLAAEVDSVMAVVANRLPQRTQVLLTETGDAVPGGVSGISDRYVGGFPYLDKLGLGARHGLEVVVKQQMIGRYGGLVNSSNCNPRPVYWVAYVHKQLVGQQVLSVATNVTDMDRLRVYAHCTQTRDSRYGPGAVTVILLNLDKARRMWLSFQGMLADKSIDEYLMTPSGDEGIQARYVSLNGVQLDMVSDSQLPGLQPRPLSPPGGVTLPPLSYGFYVIPKARLQACL